MTINSRLVRCLQVDDDPKGIARARGWIDIQHIGDVYDATLGISKGDYLAPDLVLLDIDFSIAPMTNGLQWTPDPLKLYGPILALPFLSSTLRPTVAIYSAYWPEVKRQGIPLVALSLVLSSELGRPFGVSETIAEIQRREDEQELIVHPDVALEHSLPIFRRRLAENSQLIDISMTLQQLEALVSAAASEEAGFSIATPFRIEVPHKSTELGEILSVEVIPEATGYPIRFQLHSLFADVFDFSDPVCVDDFDEVIAELESWKPHSFDRSEDAYAAAVNLIKWAYENYPHSIIEGSKHCSYSQRGLREKYRARRLAMILAWVAAWYDKPAGVEPDGNQLKSSVHVTVGLHKNQSARYRNLLGKDGRVPSGHVIPERLPLNFWTDDVSESYSLKQDRLADLSPFERYCAERYATERLGWLPTEKPYPTWMLLPRLAT